MHPRHCYELCHRYYGKIVRIEDYDGQIHFGKVVDVTDESVWIEPIHRKRFDPGFGYFHADHDHDHGCDCCDDFRSCNSRGCDFCGGFRSCDFCGFGFGGRDGRFGVFEFGFGFIVGIALAALFFI